MKFAEVILPLPVKGTFTYSIPEEFAATVERGSRVFVQFGQRKYYTGIVCDIHDRQPEAYAVKPIMMLLDGGRPIVRHPQTRFWEWMADYYLCTIGEVYKAAIPTGLKIESETFVTTSPDYDDLTSLSLTERQAAVLSVVEHEKKVSIADIEKRTGLKNAGLTVNQLMDMGAVEIDERAVEKYRPKKETFVRLTCSHDDGDALHGFFDKVNRSRLQERLLLAYIDRSKWMTPGAEPLEVTKQELANAAQASPAVFKAMVDKGIFEIYTREINRFSSGKTSEKPMLKPLSDLQREKLREIKDTFRERNVTLLHGVTGSGKTEIYTHLADTALNDGRQVLYLVPEIALTTQLTDRLREAFGSRLLVYHSKFSDNERTDIYKRLLTTHEPLVVLGARSAVFLPFAQLGLVIVDEEHENSYKQQDPAPRYNGRDSAILLASMHGAKTLLGSATPTIETYYKATHGKYGLVEMSQRYGDAKLPDISIVDMKEQRKKKLNRGILSEPLQRSMSHALSQGFQTIMFQNRRGFAPMVVCRECGWTPKCPNCDVSPVFHKRINQLRCHYCGNCADLPSVCPACGLPGIEIYGYGTERIAEDIHLQYDNYRVARMDLDTTRNKDAYQEIIEEFAQGDTDILVGTQMVSKGLDFEKVKVVGVINADTLLNFPDFRSSERAFNMLSQVAGRAGRRQEPGEVIIQTTDPSNEVLAFVKTHNYKGFYNLEISDREKFGYPPFTKVINITLRHKKPETVDNLAVAYTKMLIEVFGPSRVFGPEKPFVSRISTYYIQQIMLKVEANASMKKVKDLLRCIYERMMCSAEARSLLLHYDVDPS